MGSRRGSAGRRATDGAAMDAGALPRLKCMLEILLPPIALYSASRLTIPADPRFVCKLFLFRYEVNSICITLERQRPQHCALQSVAFSLGARGLLINPINDLRLQETKGLIGPAHRNASRTPLTRANLLGPVRLDAPDDWTYAFLYTRRLTLHASRYEPPPGGNP